MTLLTGAQENPYVNLQNSLSGVYSDQDENAITSLSVNMVSPKQSNASLYHYDVFNRMTCATLGGVTAAYSYKHDGLRISKEVDGQMTKHLWDGSQVVLELDENGQTIDRYIRGIHLIYSDKNLYYLYNAHGDTVQLTDTLGTVIRDYAYDAFGNGLDYSLYDSNPFRYSGEYLDFESGNIYLRNRYYDPATSRMLSEDPIRAGLNWYTYCNNNPVAFVDPLGLDAILVNKRIDGASWSGIDHMGAFFQDKNNDWWFFFFGEDIKYHQIVLDDQFSSYGQIFLSMDSINEYLWAHGLYAKEDVAYHSSVYVKGDFTTSHEGALAYLAQHGDGAWEKTRPIYDWLGNTINDSLGVTNRDYRFLTNNCSQVTMELFYMGILPDGTNVGDYAAYNGYGIGILPNANIVNMRNIFYNSVTNLAGFDAAMQLQRNKYEGRNALTQWWHSGLRDNINRIS